MNECTIYFKPAQKTYSTKTQSNVSSMKWDTEGHIGTTYM